MNEIVHNSRISESGGELAYKTVMNKIAVSNVLKNRVISAPMIQPSKTMRGMTSKAICIEEPTATPIARSILSLIATVTAVTC